MNQEELNHKYKLWKKRQKKLSKDWDSLRKEAKDICTHPDEFLRVCTEDCDNGYGEWYVITYRKCKICGHEYSPYDERFRT